VCVCVCIYIYMHSVLSSEILRHLTNYNDDRWISYHFFKPPYTFSEWQEHITYLDNKSACLTTWSITQNNSNNHNNKPSIKPYLLQIRNERCYNSFTYAIFKVLTALLIKIHIFWNVKQCRLIIRYLHFSQTTYQWTKWNIPADLNLLQRF